MIIRALEKRLKDFTIHFPVIVILGPRQVGKTTLAKHIMPFLKNPAIRLDLENPNDLKVIQNNPEVYFNQNKDKCIIIDEVQRLPSLFPRLRPVIDDYRKAGRFILLGSASPTLLKESSESLAGRVVYMELTPLHILELSPKEDIFSLWLKGGFPEPFLMKDFKLINIDVTEIASKIFEQGNRLFNKFGKE